MNDSMPKKCQRCGEYVYRIELHHIYRRSLRPDLIKDPKNLLALCVPCHVLATDQKAIEIELQRQFYPIPPKFRTKNDLPGYPHP